MAQAIIRSLAVKAARGRHRSQQLFAELLSETERANKQLSDEWLKTAIEYKHEWEKELARRAALGVTGPEPLPHPDDIVIDMKTGQVTVKGPMTKEEKVVWDRLRARLDESDREIEELTAMRISISGGRRPFSPCISPKIQFAARMSVVQIYETPRQGARKTEGP
jgi:benzoyl-CoA reductase/2-hydroxyglutaryl-CoA dehydratase subunit BcrC/BadD/HgdB